MSKYLKLVISLIIPQLAGLIGSIFTITSANSWYTIINKPSFNPPSWIFGPVWTTLFILMGLALYLIWNSQKSLGKQKAILIFVLQLILNTLWSILFFGLQNPLLAFVELSILWVVILFNIIYFYRLNKLSGYLLIPYILWVSFAGVLNLTIVLLN